MGRFNKGVIRDLFLLALFTGLIVALNRPSAELAQFKPKIIPPKEMVNFTLGYKTVLADSLWIRTLQADDFCENPNSKAAFNPAIKFEDALKTELAPSRCHLGWVYTMLDRITDLNPKFTRAYRVGGVQLSIAVDDREGARRLFEKGIANNPNDWELLYRAAYHYIFEIQDPVRAAELLTKATQLPNVPYIVHLLAARANSFTGKAELAIGILEDYLETESAKPGTEGHYRASERIKELKNRLSQEKQ